MAFDALLSRMRVRATAHRFRSSFRDWAGETTAFPRELAEAALADAVGNTTKRACLRGDAREKRRDLMRCLVQLCDGQSQLAEKHVMLRDRHV